MSAQKLQTRRTYQPLQNGQLWRVGEGNLKVTMVGKFLVHYKLGKIDAVRVPNSINSISVVEKYLKKNKAVLIEAQKAP